MDKQYVVAFGNPFEGLRLVGPFFTHDAACAHGEDVGDLKEWFVVELEMPDA